MAKRLETAREMFGFDIPLDPHSIVRVSKEIVAATDLGVFPAAKTVVDSAEALILDVELNKVAKGVHLDRQFGLAVDPLASRKLREMAQRIEEAIPAIERSIENRSTDPNISEQTRQLELKNLQHMLDMYRSALPRYQEAIKQDEERIRARQQREQDYQDAVAAGEITPLDETNAEELARRKERAKWIEENPEEYAKMIRQKVRGVPKEKAPRQPLTEDEKKRKQEQRIAIGQIKKKLFTITRELRQGGQEPFNRPRLMMEEALQDYDIRQNLKAAYGESQSEEFLKGKLKLIIDKFIKDQTKTPEMREQERLERRVRRERWKARKVAEEQFLERAKAETAALEDQFRSGQITKDEMNAAVEKLIEGMTESVDDASDAESKKENEQDLKAEGLTNSVSLLNGVSPKLRSGIENAFADNLTKNYFEGNSSFKKLPIEDQKAIIKNSSEGAIINQAANMLREDPHLKEFLKGKASMIRNLVGGAEDYSKGVLPTYIAVLENETILWIYEQLFRDNRSSYWKRREDALRSVDVSEKRDAEYIILKKYLYEAIRNAARRLMGNTQYYLRVNRPTDFSIVDMADEAVLPHMRDYEDQPDYTPAPGNEEDIKRAEEEREFAKSEGITLENVVTENADSPLVNMILSTPENKGGLTEEERRILTFFRGVGDEEEIQNSLPSVINNSSDEDLLALGLTENGIKRLRSVYEGEDWNLKLPAPSKNKGEYNWSKDDKALWNNIALVYDSVYGDGSSKFKLDRPLPIDPLVFNYQGAMLKAESLVQKAQDAYAQKYHQYVPREDAVEEPTTETPESTGPEVVNQPTLRDRVKDKSQRRRKKLEFKSRRIAQLKRLSHVRQLV